MKNLTHEQMIKFCQLCNCKLYTFEPANAEKTEYHLVVNTGVVGPMPEFSVTKNHFKGLGENKSINLTSKWLKYLDELKSAMNETILSI